MKSIIPLLLLATGLLLLAGCKTQQTNSTRPTKPGTTTTAAKEDPEKRKEITTLFVDALTKDAQGSTDEAITGLRLVLDKDPNHTASHYHLARLLAQQYKLPEALTHAQTALKQDPDNLFYHLKVAEIQRSMGQVDQSIAVLEAARKRFPKDLELVYDLGDLFIREKKLDKALALYDTLLELKGMDAEILRQKKEIYQYLGQKEKAVGEMQRLIQFYPTVKEYQYELYDLYKELEQNDAARTLLENLLKQDNTDAFALFRMIEIAQSENKHAYADSLADKAFQNPSVDLQAKVQYLVRLDKDPQDSLQQQRIWRLLRKLNKDTPNNPMVLSYMGEKHMIADKPDSARYYMRRAVKYDSLNLALWQQLVRLDVELQRWDSLQVDMEDAMELYPNQADLLYWHAQASYMNKQYETCIASAKRFVKMNEDLRNSDMQVLIGDCHHHLKQYAESDQAYEKAIKLNPRNATALNNYAYFLSVRGERLEDAARMADQAMKMRPGEASFMDTYGWILYRQGKYDEALKWIQKAYELQAEGEVAEHLGDVYDKLGMADKAREYWKIAQQKGQNSPELLQKLAKP